MVKKVIHSDGTKEVIVAVKHWSTHKVVGGEVTGRCFLRIISIKRRKVRIQSTADQGTGGFTQQLLQVYAPQIFAGRGLLSVGGQRKMRDDNDVVKSGLRAIARASATVVCGGENQRLRSRMSAPTVSGEKSINRRTGADSSGSMSSSSTSALSSGSSPSKSAASSGSISSSTTAARSMARASMSSACRSSGRAPGECQRGARRQAVQPRSDAPPPAWHATRTRCRRGACYQTAR